MTLNADRAAPIKYWPSVAAVVVLLILGGGLIALSQVVEPVTPFSISVALRDFGLAFGPMAAITGVYEFIMRRDVERNMRDLARGFSYVDIIPPINRTEYLADIIKAANNEIIVSGVAPLLEFEHQLEWLIDNLKRLQSIKVASLATDSPYIATRVAQSGEDDILQEIMRHDKILASITAALPGKLEVIRYNRPPAEFFYIADQRIVLASWYPTGRRGESCPLMFVDNADKSDKSKKLLAFLLDSFRIIEQ